MRVGILTEFPSPAVQSGPALHTRFLAEGLKSRGHGVVVMGPDTGSEAPINGFESHLYSAHAYPTHPSVKIAMPGPMRTLANPPKLDVVHGQSNSFLPRYAAWLRQMNQVAVLNTHTVHLPSHSHFVLSDRLYRNDRIRQIIRQGAEGMEFKFARLYNMGDALIVQSRFYKSYWRDRGVTVPIEVVDRPIDPAKFSRQPGADPFPASFRMGKRLLVVCRHDREKSLAHLVDIFSRHIAPADPEVTLTLVGDGHDHGNLVDQAMASPHARRIHFPGEACHDEIVDWYAHADVFVYTSMSETFGNVVNEARWSGLPVVALDDNMGVAHQVAPGVSGFLVEPGRQDTDESFAAAVGALTSRREMRRKMGEEGANLARQASHPDVVLRRFESIYEAAIERCRREVPVPLVEQSRFHQMRALTASAAVWGWYNGLLLGFAHLATRLGASRTGGASQHTEAMARHVSPGVAHAESRPAA